VIKESDVTLSLKKCRFGKSRAKFCGQIVGSGTRQADPDKVAAVQNLLSPKTKTELRRILGSFNYFRDYIPNYAERVLPLTRLTGKDTPNKLPWTAVEQQVLDELKDALSAATQEPLNIIDWRKPFSIHCDASDHTVSGVLSQTQEEQGSQRPVAFFSSKLTPAQRNWAVVEKEAYAALLALRKFRGWMWRAPEVVLYSGHNPVDAVCTGKREANALGACIARIPTKMAIQERC
jgi:hypothetical protein